MKIVSSKILDGWRPVEDLTDEEEVVIERDGEEVLARKQDGVWKVEGEVVEFSLWK